MSPLAAAAVTIAAAAGGATLASLRWLRVAQREHYLPGSVSRFAQRWWTFGPNLVLAVATLVALALAVLGPVAIGVISAAGVAVGPFGLGVRGRTSKLAWTPRLRRLGGVWAVVSILPVAAVAVFGIRPAAVMAVLVAVATPFAVDLACAVTAPVERQLLGGFVDRAAARLREVEPTVVAITGSYGKTGTKGYVVHLLGAVRSVVASPASFNNMGGLSRAVNEHLTPGTEVFVAEMGTYGPGEIAEMCAWVRPSIGVITAIGPVHLERFGSEDRITEAKAEILAGVEVAVLNADDPRLAVLADRIEAAGGRKVVRARAADVAGFDLPAGTPATNAACAVAVARHLGVPDDMIAARLRSLPTPPNRLTTTTGSTGSTIIDDTYNSNPAGAAAALAALERSSSPGGKRVVVTPGMVELGSRQASENARFGEAVASGAGSHLVVVGHTNRRALTEGAAHGRVQVVLVDHHDDAVAWVREHAGPGDAVLYENDLPDHFA